MSSDLLALLRRDPVVLADVATRLEALTHGERLAWIRGLPGGILGRLFDAAAGNPITAEDLVPAAVPDGVTVRHLGINSLPLFRLVEKPMYRGEDGEIYGNNVQAWQWLTGPGYFKVGPDRAPSAEGATATLAFDYTRLPGTPPTGWPRVMSNRRGFSYLVFRDLFDVMRRVSDHVTIGHAYRGDHSLGQYFALVREPYQVSSPNPTQRAETKR